jgi:hypothetical protein
MNCSTSDNRNRTLPPYFLAGISKVPADILFLMLLGLIDKISAVAATLRRRSLHLRQPLSVSIDLLMSASKLKTRRGIKGPSLNVPAGFLASRPSV